MKSPNSSSTLPKSDAAAGGAALSADSLVSRALARSPEPLAVARSDGALVFVNDAMLEAAGLDAGGPPPADLFALFELFCAGEPDDPTRALREAACESRPLKYEAACPATGLIFALDVRPVTRRAGADDGTGATAGGADAEVVLEGGGAARVELLGFAFAARDVTRLREAERVRGAALSLVSHELRTPLTSISGFAELLAADETLPAETREFLSIIRDESQRLTRMVNVFLTGDGADHSEDPEGRRLTPLSLDEVAREAVGGLRRAAGARGVNLVHEGGPRLPPVAADGPVVKRAVVMLLAHALDRAPAGATVTVSTDLEADAVVLAAEISPGPADATPAPAMITDSDSADSLAPVRAAAEKHGGRLLSAPRAAGTRLVFTLPRL